ncbi:hypothetical protein [Amycolatopsis alkalitolerans]|uniref:Uncharacterized protein n=1 Tax=Amycolatopsis alkalitolerans TaxID=2547244 RepID=A0A5C4LX00_9PSEU|nr:hypothetical protein [Amycolatopsis alkalitolerans]TNC24087.1 hypothetical protein FG385_18605 [Amycolatopsis alkalitolerans]
MVAPQYPPAGGGGTAPLPRIPAAPARGRARLLKAMGLVAVAVVAGLVWWLIRHEPEAPVAQAPAKEFSFTAAGGPVAGTDCAGKSTGEVRRWFADHACRKLTRALFTTNASGSKALVSVVVVTMPTDAGAGRLKALVDTDGTGNVLDLVHDGTARIAGAPALAGGEYASHADGNRVTIVLSAFFDGRQDRATLGRVNTEALDLATRLG